MFHAPRDLYFSCPGQLIAQADQGPPTPRTVWAGKTNAVSVLARGIGESRGSERIRREARTARRQIMVEVARDTRALGRRYETAAWGALLIWFGVLSIIRLPSGPGVLGIGVILLG